MDGSSYEPIVHFSDNVLLLSISSCLPAPGIEKRKRSQDTLAGAKASKSPRVPPANTELVQVLGMQVCVPLPKDKKILTRRRDECKGWQTEQLMQGRVLPMFLHYYKRLDKSAHIIL